MGISLANQTSTFLFACGVGFGLGLLYDLFRIIRIAFQPGKVFIFFQDILYWVISAVITFLFILTINFGEVRGYLLIGELFGGMIYYCSLGVLVIGSAKVIIRAIKSFLHFLYRLFIRPVLKVFKGIFGFLAKKTKKVAKKSKKTTGNIKNILKHRGKVLYNLMASKKVKKKKTIKPKERNNFHSD